jgi:hypothetical protein
MTACTTARPSATPASSRRASHLLSGLAAGFLLFDGVLHLLRPVAVARAFADLGYPVALARPFGMLELLCLALYLVPRSAPLGAVLLTGYLSGAVSAHARLQDSLLGSTLFPVYLAVLLWAGLWLRDKRVRALTAPRT